MEDTHTVNRTKVDHFFRDSLAVGRGFLALYSVTGDRG